jgi:hypothetical protein
MYSKSSVPVIILLLLAAGCSEISSTLRNCPDGAIEWVDILKFNDVEYHGYVDGSEQVDPAGRGSVLGEVTFKMADNACSDHNLRNGDAAYLPEGTIIYEYTGFSPDFRVLAGNKVYQVQHNDAAQTFDDLFDIHGNLEQLSIDSSYDGRTLTFFPEEEAAMFIDDFLTLDYEGFDEIYPVIETESGPGVFIGFHLTDGTSFQLTYWVEENVINPGGFATERMQEIILSLTEGLELEEE